MKPKQTIEQHTIEKNIAKFSEAFEPLKPFNVYDFFITFIMFIVFLFYLSLPTAIMENSVVIERMFFFVSFFTLMGTYAISDTIIYPINKYANIQSELKMNQLIIAILVHFLMVLFIGTSVPNIFGWTILGVIITGGAFLGFKLGVNHPKLTQLNGFIKIGKSVLFGFFGALICASITFLVYSLINSLNSLLGTSYPIIQTIAYWLSVISIFYVSILLPIIPPIIKYYKYPNSDIAT